MPGLRGARRSGVNAGEGWGWGGRAAKREPQNSLGRGRTGHQRESMSPGPSGADMVEGEVGTLFCVKEEVKVRSPRERQRRREGRPPLKKRSCWCLSIFPQRKNSSTNSTRHCLPAVLLPLLITTNIRHTNSPQSHLTQEHSQS